MNVFELASQYRHLEALADAERDDTGELLAAWLEVEGDLNAKIENIGFAIKNSEAVLAGKQEAIKVMEASAISTEKKIERLKKLAIDIMSATGQKKAGGQYLTLSAVPTQGRIEIEDESKLPPEYLREIPAVAASTAPDKKKIAEDMKLGVVVPGAKHIPGVRLKIA